MFTNQIKNTDMGLAYLEVCKVLGANTFTHVVLLPFIVNTGAEKYIFGVIDAIKRADKGARFLFVAGEEREEHMWLEKLPKGSVFLDLCRIGLALTQEQREIILLRVLQATSSNACIHLKTCGFVLNFIKRFGAMLATNKLVYYHFCENSVKMSDGWMERGVHFDFLAEYGELFAHVISDNETIFEREALLLDYLTDKFRVLKLPVDVTIKPVAPERDVTRKLLWASRLDSQKRPELISAIAKRLAARGMNIQIDVFGYSVFGQFQPERLSQIPGVKYCGAFDGFSALPYEQYDALLYTSAFDGLPNIVLEALAAGLPVFAPDIGGIREVVGSDVGYLIENSWVNGELADGYADAIEKHYHPDTPRSVLSVNATESVRKRHRKDVFDAEVKTIFMSQ